MKISQFKKHYSIFFAFLEKRNGGIILFLAIFLVFAFITRIVLMIKSAQMISWDVSILAAFVWGFLYDIGAASWLAIPLIILQTVAPKHLFERPWGRFVMNVILFVFIYSMLFGLAAEWVFWDEFGVRFNFIAVDYLVYTNEVIKNIFESYPMPLILSGIAILSFLLCIAIWRTGLLTNWAENSAAPAGVRYKFGVFACAGAIAVGLIVNQTWLPDFTNNYNRELGKNGLWSLFAAFKDNELEFNKFFPTVPVDKAFQFMRAELVEDGSVLLRPQEKDTLRLYSKEGPELKLNVIQITVESLSTEFLANSGRYTNLTPNLAAIEQKSLVFDNFYATGTRTDRGMEALTLSMPPTPGRSLVKRPHNEGLFTLGSIFRWKGYETAFLYSGYGYFDNMNYFFGNNGYKVIDRNAVSRNDVTFANAWGACDEDLYRWTMREADAVHAQEKPFHFFVMTTSNHRPFTFPEGRIDLPSKTSGRRGGVKYTDYAIGKFIKDASSKPWFNNTVFVIVADHCAGSAGKTELPVKEYHIPLIIYAPGGQLPTGHIKTITSQVDYAPTLLGLLNWSYPSRFFGHDVRAISPDEGHAIIGNYQKLGHIEEGKFIVLKTMRKNVAYRYDFASQSMINIPVSAEPLTETISYYQVASYLYKHKLYNDLTADEFDTYMRQGPKLAAKEAYNVSKREPDPLSSI
jgi:phosphoglycerol transferase MdoB-like AlkP superfamily enzyme